MTPSTRARLQMHACVFLWGFTAILGKLIHLRAVALVFWRVLVVVGVLFLLPRVRRGVAALGPRLLLGYLGAGAVVALHWVTFYGAIKLANASVGALCMALAPALVAVTEPWIAGRRFDARELALGASVLPGVGLVVGGVPAGMRAGLGVGVVSAVLVAIFGALNKRLVHAAHPIVITGVELTGSLAVLSLLAALPLGATTAVPIPDRHDAALLLVLSTACTLLPFALSLAALRHLTAYEAQLTVNLEPVYSIVLAVLFLGEERELGVAFYAGVALVLGAVLVYPVLKARASQNGR